MVNGRKLDNILKQGSLTTSSSAFANLLTATLLSTDKMVYIEAWAKAQNGNSSNFFKRIVTAAYGSSTLTLMDGYVLSPIEELIDSDNSEYDARISVNGTTVQLQVHSANNESTTFYGYLDVHIIEYANYSPITIFGNDLELWIRSDMGISLDASDRVTRWEDQSGKGNHLTQATGALRPAYSYSDANWGGVPTLTFDVSATDTSLYSEHDGSYWKFLHDGTGGFSVIVFRPNSASVFSYIMGTSDVAPAIGFRVVIDPPTTISTYMQAFNGTGTMFTMNATLSVAGEYYYIASAFEDGRAGNEAAIWTNGLLEETGNTGSTPSTANSNLPFQIGAKSDGTVGLDGEIVEVIAASVYPTDTQLANLDTYLSTRYGATPKQILGEDLVAWYRSDLGITTVSGAVSEWADQSGNGHTLTQSSAGARPTYNTTDANWNNLPSLTFDGSADYLVSAELDAWKFLHDGSGGGALVVFRCEETGTNTGNLISTGAGTSTAAGMRLEQSADNGSESRYTVSNGLSYLFNVVTGGPVENTNAWALACYEEGRGGNEYLFRRDGYSDQTGNSATFPTSNSPSGQLRVGVRVGGTVFYQGDIVEVILFKVYPSAAQLEQLSRYISFRYNL